MARAFLLIRLTLVLVGGLAAVAASAGGPAGDATRKSGNTFTLITVGHGRRPPGERALGRASIAPKAVVTNPYHVPLLQNAGSLRSGR